MGNCGEAVKRPEAVRVRTVGAGNKRGWGLGTWGRERERVDIAGGMERGEELATRGLLPCFGPFANRIIITRPIRVTAKQTVRPDTRAMPGSGD